MNTRQQLSQRHKRRGAVAVECAVIVPVLLTIVMGLIQVNRAYDAQNLMQTAVREGARFAAMDRSDMDQGGQSTNEKLINDVKSFLGTSGLPVDSLSVEILDASDPSQSFDIDDPDNDLQLFIVRASLDFSEVSYSPVSESYDYPMIAQITFRNGRATLSE